LVFNALVTASRKKLAGNVAALRGTTQNLAAAIGTVVADALPIGLPESELSEDAYFVDCLRQAANPRSCG
jgi:hypothetical protein